MLELLSKIVYLVRYLAITVMVTSQSSFEEKKDSFLTKMSIFSEKKFSWFFGLKFFLLHTIALNFLAITFLGLFWFKIVSRRKKARLIEIVNFFDGHLK